MQDQTQLTWYQLRTTAAVYGVTAATLVCWRMIQLEFANEIRENLKGRTND